MNEGRKEGTKEGKEEVKPDGDTENQ